jgi:hypothetical protein
MHAHDTYLRWLYRGGRPSRFGRVLNRLSAVMFSAGIMPSRAATLEITVYRIQPRVAASATTATGRQPASPPARLG